MNLKLQIYSLGIYTNNFIIKNLNHANTISLIIIFLGGVLSSFNPCTISISPLYFAYIQNFKYDKKPTNYHNSTLTFFIGIVTSIVMFGLISLYIGRRYGSTFNTTSFLYPITIMIVGLSLMNIISVDYSNIIQLYKHPWHNNINIYLIGVIIGFIITPCSTSILITLLLWINYTKDFFTGLIFLTTYTIGYIIPLITITYLTTNFTTFSFIKNYWFTLSNIIGAILLGIGTFYLLYYIIHSF